MVPLWAAATPPSRSSTCPPPCPPGTPASSTHSTSSFCYPVPPLPLAWRMMAQRVLSGRYTNPSNSCIKKHDEFFFEIYIYIFYKLCFFSVLLIAGVRLGRAQGRTRAAGAVRRGAGAPDAPPTSAASRRPPPASLNQRRSLVGSIFLCLHLNKNVKIHILSHFLNHIRNVYGY